MKWAGFDPECGSRRGGPAACGKFSPWGVSVKWEGPAGLPAGPRPAGPDWHDPCKSTKVKRVEPKDRLELPEILELVEQRGGGGR